MECSAPSKAPVTRGGCAICFNLRPPQCQTGNGHRTECMCTALVIRKARPAKHPPLIGPGRLPAWQAWPARWWFSVSWRRRLVSSVSGQGQRGCGDIGAPPSGSASFGLARSPAFDKQCRCLKPHRPGRLLRYRLVRLPRPVPAPSSLRRRAQRVGGCRPAPTVAGTVGEGFGFDGQAAERKRGGGSTSGDCAAFCHRPTRFE